MVFMKFFINSKCCNFTYSAVKIETNVVIAEIKIIVIAFQNTLTIESVKFSRR
jgi:hypothetical protein